MSNSCTTPKSATCPSSECYPNGDALCVTTPSTQAQKTGGELAIFEQAETPIHLIAEGETRFVLGAAPQHPHDLSLGSYSIHNSDEALARGESEVRRIGRMLRQEGKQRRALWLFS